MGIPIHEIKMYKDFEELANDVVELAKEILPDKLIYLTSFSDRKQIVLRLSDTNSSILLTEGMAIPLNETVCNRIDFENRKPLIYEDISKENSLDDLRESLYEMNIRSYLGIPISLGNGDRFGTLCAAHDAAVEFDEKSISSLQKIAKMFSFYLELERLAYRDSLTGLYNRQYLYKFSEEMNETAGVLFYLDLDGFKKVNDVYGHDVGDLVLKEVGIRLKEYTKEQVQEDAFAVRLGGDEFIIMFPGDFSKDEISNRAENLLKRLSNWDEETERYQLSVSIGIAFFTAENDIPSQIKNADQALYRAKADGKNNYQFS